MDQANYYGWNIDHGYITSDKNVFFQLSSGTTKTYGHIDDQWYI